MKYSISEVVKKLNINKETIRYYEKIGLLKDTKRDSNGYRVYSDNDIETLQFIRMAKDYDFTLKEIEILLNKIFDRNKNLNKEAASKIVEDKIIEIEEKIKELDTIKKVLYKVKSDVLEMKNICYCGKSAEEILNS